MSLLHLLLITCVTTSLGAMEQNENQALADRNLLSSGLKTIQILHADKEFKIKKYADQKKLYKRCIGSWLIQTVGELNQPFEQHLIQAGINQDWFCQCLQRRKSKNNLIKGNELVHLLWNKYHQKK
jgi:aryl carrier-like protein